jgi:hypothetical protein
MLEDSEYRQIARMARRRQMSISAWVRRALTAARHREQAGDIDKKLEALRTATRFEFPTGDMADILVEIEQGYLRDDREPF